MMPTRPPREPSGFIPPRTSPTPSGDNVGYGLPGLSMPEPIFNLKDLEGMEGKDPAVEYRAALAVKVILDKLPGLPFDKRAAIAMVAAVLILNDEPSVKARRGKVINVMTDTFRAMLQAYLE